MTFPHPSHTQLERSKLLSAHIQNTIKNASDNVISFASFMNLALYTPELGYYMADHEVFGWSGDFTTAPELSPLFAQCLARPCLQALQATGGNILEIGAGSGKLAVELLKSLPERPNHYYIYEISPALRKRQQDSIKEQLPDFYQQIIWLEELPKDFTGIILANEVMDALPARCIMLTEQGYYERGVSREEEQFIWRNYAADEEVIELIHKIHPEKLPRPYLSEIQTSLSTWIHTIAETLQQGVVLLIDYGFPRKEYYHPDRSMGTLMCHFRQYAHADPFWYPGVQDITVHVDFTQVEEIANVNALELIGYTSQANFLIDCGLIDILETNPNPTFAEKNQVQTLTSPAEMGELFKAMALARNCDIPLAGFKGSIRALV